jgi:hypothetical protein
MPQRLKPVHEIRLGRIRAAIWANRGESHAPWFNITISRLYKDGEQWKDSTSFGRDDLPLVAKAADMAYAWIWSQETATVYDSGSGAIANDVQRRGEHARERIRQLEEEINRLRDELEHARIRLHRERLPATRRSLTHKFAVGQHEGYLTVGLYDDHRPGELFLTMAKEGSTIGGLIDTIGILTSLTLQYGVSVETLARKFEHVSFEPSGWTREPTIRRASSVVDYIFRWLGMQFSEAYRREKLAACGILPEGPKPPMALSTTEQSYE